MCEDDPGDGGVEGGSDPCRGTAGDEYTRFFVVHKLVIPLVYVCVLCVWMEVGYYGGGAGGEGVGGEEKTRGAIKWEKQYRMQHGAPPSPSQKIYHC